jgi:hypothetical protein
MRGVGSASGSVGQVALVELRANVAFRKVFELLIVVAHVASMTSDIAAKPQSKGLADRMMSNTDSAISNALPSCQVHSCLMQGHTLSSTD